MPIYGMTPQGFIPKRLRDIRESLLTRMALIQDPVTLEFPLANITDDQVLSQVVGIFADELGVAWGAAADAYAQFDPQLNTGAGQSGTVQLNAITRKPGVPTQIAITVTGLAGIVVAAGAQVATTSGDEVYAVDTDIVLQGATNATVTATGTASSTVNAPYNPDVNTVITIQSPVAGWYSVTNTRTITVGMAEETDSTLRIRQQRSTSLTSYRQIEAIWAAVYNLDGVTYARAYQNSETQPQDARGIPFKEVAVIVEGGDDKAIAEELFYRFPTGQIGYGSTTVILTDRQNFQYPISFSRPKPVPVYIAVTVQVYDSMDWPSNGAELIAQNIVEYARYNQEDATVGFPPGTAVVRTRLYTPINWVQGHRVTALTLGTSPNALTENDIPVQWDELAIFDTANITVTVSG